eukprot:4266947-Pleurochrysis_carterae.AAC.3
MEPISPPALKPATTRDHSARASGCPCAAKLCGTICSRLFSEPVANPNWKEDPAETANTVTASRTLRQRESGEAPSSGAAGSCGAL